MVRDLPLEARLGPDPLPYAEAHAPRELRGLAWAHAAFGLVLVLMSPGAIAASASVAFLGGLAGAALALLWTFFGIGGVVSLVAAALLVRGLRAGWWLAVAVDAVALVCGLLLASTFWLLGLPLAVPALVLTTLLLRPPVGTWARPPAR